MGVESAVNSINEFRLSMTTTCIFVLVCLKSVFCAEVQSSVKATNTVHRLTVHALIGYNFFLQMWCNFKVAAAMD